MSSAMWDDAILTVKKLAIGETTELGACRSPGLGGGVANTAV